MTMKITRRIFALAVIAAPIFVFSLANSATPPAAAAHPHYLALVGTYTTKTQSKGIYAYDFDPETGKLTDKGIAAETPDPSWVIIHPNGKFAYAANEAGKKSTISAFSLDAQSGKLKLLNDIPSLGEDPCYLSFDKRGDYLLVANYTSGTVAAFPILPDGKLGEDVDMVKDAGPRGPDKKRQEGPHAHWVQVSEHNHYAYVADLGLDRILIYKFDEAKGSLTPGDTSSATTKAGAAKATNDSFTAVLAPGTGPRHAVFSHDGNFLYVLGEMKSNVTVLSNEARESFRSIQEISALPADFSGRNDAAEIALHPSGKWLYTSNRGHDSIAVFSVDQTTGKLALLADVPTGGKEPRHYAITQPTGVAHVPSPVCLVFYPVQ
jgi:6-phosphogluconolactonase